MQYTERDKIYLQKLKTKWLDFDTSMQMLNKARQDAWVSPVSSIWWQIDWTWREEILNNQVVNQPEKWVDVLWGIWTAAKWIWKWALAIWWVVDETLMWAIASTPKIVWNVAWWIAEVWWDVVQKIWNLFWASMTEEQSKWLANFLREKWVKWEEWLQEALQVDPDSFFTKTWAFWTEIASMFTPSWLTRIVPWLAKAKWIVWWITEWIEAWLKWELVSEWEISPEWVLVGWAIWGTLRAASQWLNKILPRTKEAIKEKLKDSVQWLIKFTAKSWKNAKTAVQERTNFIEGWKTLQAFNPEFKIADKANSLEEVWGTISSTKTKLFDEMRAIREWADNVAINTKEVAKEFSKLAKNNKEFKALIEKWGWDTEFNRLMWTLKKDWKFFDEDLADSYEAVKIFNSKSGNLFSSNADNVSWKVNSALSKVYNDIMDKKIWSLWGKYRDLNKAYSQVRNFENSVASRFRTELWKSKSNTLWNLWDAYLDASLIFNVFNPAAAWQVLTTKVLKDFFRKQGNPNSLMFDFMQNVRRFHWLEKEVITETWLETAKQIWKKAIILQAEELTK